MPTAILLVSTLVSSLLTLTVLDVSRDARLNQRMLQSMAALYAGSSSAEVSWQMTTGNSVDSVKIFVAQKDKDALATRKSLGEGEIEANQGVAVKSVRNSLKTPHEFSDSFFQRYHAEGAAVFLYKVSSNQAVSSLVLEYCVRDQKSCPDLVVEWLVMEENFNFQDLSLLQESLGDETLSAECFEIPGTGTTRCSASTGVNNSAPNSDLHTGDTPSDSSFQRQVELRTPGFDNKKNYLFRFRTRDSNAVDFALYGNRGGNKVVLPNTVFESDDLTESQNSKRRVRDQKGVSGGMQKGLEWGQFFRGMGY